MARVTGTRFTKPGTRVAGFNSNTFVRGRLQAALYHNRQRRLERLEQVAAGPVPPGFGGGYGPHGAVRLSTDRAIHYRFQSTTRGNVLCIRAFMDTNGVEVNITGALYLSSAQDLTGTPAARLRLAEPVLKNIPNGAPENVDLLFLNAPPINVGDFAHISVGTDNVASWGIQTDDNSGDDDQFRSTAIANTALGDPADITGPIDDIDVSAYIITKPNDSSSLFGSYGSAYDPSYG